MLQCYWKICTISWGVRPSWSSVERETVSSSLVLRLTNMTPGISVLLSQYFNLEHVDNVRVAKIIILKDSLWMCFENYYVSVEGLYHKPVGDCVKWQTGTVSRENATFQSPWLHEENWFHDHTGSDCLSSELHIIECRWHFELTARFNFCFAEVPVSSHVLLFYKKGIRNNLFSTFS